MAAAHVLPVWLDHRGPPTEIQQLELQSAARSTGVNSGTMANC